MSINPFQIKFFRRIKISHLIIFFCVFVFTIGQFIPIYFQDYNIRPWYYISLIIILTVTVLVESFYKFYRVQKINLFLSIVGSFLYSIITFVAFSLLTLFFNLGVWTDAGTYFVKKAKPNIKIVRRYVNLGAFGGGTNPEDYEMVKRVSILIFNIDTKIDTSKIDKNKWKRITIP